MEFIRQEYKVQSHNLLIKSFIENSPETTEVLHLVENRTVSEAALTRHSGCEYHMKHDERR